jgi:hypothetical protein
VGAETGSAGLVERLQDAAAPYDPASGAAGPFRPPFAEAAR